MALRAISLNAARRAWKASVVVSLKGFLNSDCKIAVWGSRGLSRQVVGHVAYDTIAALIFARVLSPRACDWEAMEIHSMC